MEPVITAALITAGTKLFGTFIEVWNTSHKNDKKQEGVNKWIAEYYDSLHDSLSADCVRLLAEVDDGKRLRVGDFAKVLYSKHSLDEKYLHILKKELRYRLEFLVVIGVLRHLPHIGRYEITRLGVSFLVQARAKKHYRTVLLKQ